MPSPPVPELSATLERYLEGLKCILPAADYAEAEAQVEEFQREDGVELQKLLQEYARQKDNWVRELFCRSTQSHFAHVENRKSRNMQISWENASTRVLLAYKQ